MSVLVLAEHDNKNLHHASLTTLSAASQFGMTVDVLVIGYECHAIAEQVAKVSGVAKVLYADNEVYQYHFAENIAEFLVRIGQDYSHLLAPATTFGKNILPRAAAKLDVAQISDVIEIINDKTFIRPIYAGNALETVESLDKIKILTIRQTAFPVVDSKQNPAAITKLDMAIKATGVEFKERKVAVTERPELTNAKIVVSGGRGLQSAANFKLLEKLADQLNAAVGATRAAVDAGYVPNDWQVGQTGKVVAPDLYIAIGISGAIQHLAGMKDSKVIVAINKDPDAPIFQIADYGLVADLFKVLPELQRELEKLGYNSTKNEEKNL